MSLGKLNIFWFNMDTCHETPKAGIFNWLQIGNFDYFNFLIFEKVLAYHKKWDEKIIGYY